MRWVPCSSSAASRDSVEGAAGSRAGSHHRAAAASLVALASGIAPFRPLSAMTAHWSAETLAQADQWPDTRSGR